MPKFLIAAAAALMFCVTSSDIQAQEGSPPAKQGDERMQGRSGPGGGAGRRGRRGGGRGGQGGQRGSRMAAMLSALPVMKALDADGNGEISAAEISNASKALAALDKDGDGVLKSAELMPDFSQMGGGRPGAGVAPGAGGGPGAGGPGAGGARGGRASGGGSRPSLTDRLAEMDTNKDGKLAKDEAPEWMQGMFANFDTNGDGFATKEELEEATKRIRSSRGGGRGGRSAQPKAKDNRPAFDDN